ncbi:MULTISPECIES: alpha/beta fold hydrolase [Pseudonocardia]|uniref:Fluoroacetate dehalogenase n=2 Tax=Pseudonocardia TaxID=1847 RepID=A0A1Y2MX53_PSEAH|nr:MULTISPECIES: alpha/beta hydrolase [Pseudonocardia]OSY39701.1 Fluoroacetate dehalogenase [Pseudonocardia autotrophica]TDN72831.1 haloacetate dehalogenase [Pseudonocardia autotrophica]BBG03549.1 epoxide hydrolase [Pseudonocardia autotrophica]GEC28562.1 epoxide hydrolase [Pseudonocardia saturnea]
MSGIGLPGRPQDVRTPSGGTVRVRQAGQGPPVLLLHGWPQTSVMWHRVAPGLIDRHTVVLADLPGYGDSTLPAGAEVAVSGKRTMAADLVAVMAALGHERFAVVGHDRGARCGYRMALDHPGTVSALAVLDILPTADVLARAGARFARGAIHWFLLSQPTDLAERLVAAEPEAILGRGLAEVCDPAALDAYAAAWARPEVVHGMCQDYRAGFDVDAADDEADRGLRTISAPTLVLWGRRGPLGRESDVLQDWRVWAPEATGRALDAGHLLAEEAPGAVLAELAAFLPATSEYRRH